MPLGFLDAWPLLVGDGKAVKLWLPIVADEPVRGRGRRSVVDAALNSGRDRVRPNEAVIDEHRLADA